MTSAQTIKLSPFKHNDAADLVKWFADKYIHDNTLHIPFPYREEDALKWIAFSNSHKSPDNKYLNLALRGNDGKLIGGIGFSLPDLPQLMHQGELGYWMAKPFRNKGIITEAIKLMCNYGFTELGLVRITAHIFSCNIASEKVLQKAGFVLEGEFRKFYFKNGKYIDAKVYALLN